MTDELRFYLLKKRLAEELILRAFRAFRNCDIEPILIKGWAAARHYPTTEPRFSGDIDLAVSASDYEKAKNLTKSSASTLGSIDLHRELRHLDTLDWERLFANSELIELDGEQVRVLGAEDHLRVLCVHWLTNGGEDRKRLWDIVYAVRNRPAEFDWSRCLDVVSTTRQQWIVATIGIAHKYMGLELDEIPFADEARKLPTWLTRCLEKEWSENLELRALESQLKNPRGFLRQVRKRIPPNPIQATIDCEGEFGDGSRIGYQIRDMLKRFLPSVRRISSAIMEK